nr:hypothetical protein [Tanacetum cinerariifolium]
MTSFGSRLKPLYPIKECSSCGALYTADYCCSNGSLVDKIICDPNKAPDFPHLHTLSSNKFYCFHCKDELGDGEVCKRCTCTRCGSGLYKGICLICKQRFLNTSPSISLNSSQSPPQIRKASATGDPSKRFNSFCFDDDDDDDEDYTTTITPSEPVDSLSMGDEHLNTISTMELDESIKSSVKNLVPNPIDSLLDEFADELTLLKSISPGIDETDYHLENEIRVTERLFDSHMEEIDLSFNPDDPMPLSIKDDDNDFEGDNLFLERLLHDDPIPLSDTLDFSNVVRVFLPFFTYPLGLSHRCGTFKKFNTHHSHLNENPMEMLFSTYFPLDQL